MTTHSASQPAHLLLLEALPTISGGQAALVGLAAHLKAHYMLSALLPGEGPLAEALRQHDTRCYFGPLGSYSLVRKTAKDVVNYAIRVPWLTLFACRLIRRQRIDLLYANGARTFVWATVAASLAGRPIIWHHHNVLADRKSLRILQAVGRLPALRRIVCASATGSEQFPKLRGKTIVIPTGVDTDKYHPDESAGRRVKSQLDIPEDTPVIGMVGDLIPLKGHATFLTAAQTVLGQIPAAKFLVVGGARAEPTGQKHERDLLELSKTLGLNDAVIFTGQRSDIPSVLNALNVLVIASTTETGPLVLLEALSSGIPVLSTPVGRGPELLADGACGGLYPIGDAPELALRLVALLSNPGQQAQMRQNARQRAVERLPRECFEVRILAEISRYDGTKGVC
jgi:glycosyltransferase involved in cell wall biosynthesis